MEPSFGATPAGDAASGAGFGAALLCRNWGWFALRGVLALALGVLAFLFPADALFAFTLVFAAYAAIDGLLSIAAGIYGATHHRERWGALILRGLVGIAAAILFLAMPVVATVGYALAALAMLMVWAIVTGASEIAAAVRLRKEIEGEWLLGLTGLVSILLGLAVPVALVVNPIATILSVAWVLAIWAVVAGVALIALALRLRRMCQARAAAG